MLLFGENEQKVCEISLYYFLEVDMNLQLSKYSQVDIRNKFFHNRKKVLFIVSWVCFKQVLGGDSRRYHYILHKLLYSCPRLQTPYENGNNFCLNDNYKASLVFIFILFRSIEESYEVTFLEIQLFNIFFLYIYCSDSQIWTHLGLVGQGKTREVVGSN